ncbi:MAG: hypothetical protein CMK59_10365 [Proteobacteria bacterium]|nr:hypothetical protein [Pseudomonadota bacterium]
MSLPFRQTTALLLDAEKEIQNLSNNNLDLETKTCVDQAEEKHPVATDCSNYARIETPYGRLLIDSHIAMLKKTQSFNSKSSDVQNEIIRTWPMDGWEFITLDETQSFAIFANQSDWRFALLDLLKGTLEKDEDPIFPRFWIEDASTGNLGNTQEDLFHCRKTGLRLVLLPEE